MTRIAMLIRDALRQDGHREPDVHFHATSGGQEVCHDQRCGRPRLSVQ